MESESAHFMEVGTAPLGCMLASMAIKDSKVALTLIYFSAVMSATVKAVVTGLRYAVVFAGTRSK